MESELNKLRHDSPRFYSFQPVGERVDTVRPHILVNLPVPRFIAVLEVVHDTCVFYRPECESGGRIDKLKETS